MSPRTLGGTALLPVHDHSSKGEGGPIADENVALLDRTATQTFTGAVVFTGFATTAAIELEDLNTTPIQSVVGAYICTLGAAAVTDARAWNLPDASGDFVVSKTSVAIAPRTTSVSGNVLTGPEAGVYAFLVYAECTTAGAAGALAVVVGHTGDSALSQVAIAALALNALGCASALIVARVVSGDVTYAATISAGVGSPAYRLNIAPIGRIA